MTGKLRVAMLGCGRQGKVHCENFVSNPRCEVLACVDPNPQSKTWVSSNMPSSVKFFSTPDALYSELGCKKGAKPGSGKLDAVIISTETDSHERLCIQAIGLGLHVLLEKPISIGLEAHHRVIEAAKKRPEVKVLIALSRRFDPSYQAAKARILKGDLGQPFLVKSATVDMYDDLFLNYSLKSGGIWTDCGIHDIDCARYLLGVTDSDAARSSTPLPRPQRVYATGTNVRIPELMQYGDADSTIGQILFSDGRSAAINLGRSGFFHEASCDVQGTKSRFSINTNPRIDRLTIMDEQGVRNECTLTYAERFRDAFVNETKEFIASCLDSTPLPVTLNDALEGARIATGLTWSLRSGLPVYFDEKGDPIPPKGGKSIESDENTAIVSSKIFASKL